MRLVSIQSPTLILIIVFAIILVLGWLSCTLVLTVEVFGYILRVFATKNKSVSYIGADDGLHKTVKSTLREILIAGNNLFIHSFLQEKCKT